MARNDVHFRKFTLRALLRPRRRGLLQSVGETQGAPELSWGQGGTQGSAGIQEGLREGKESRISTKVPVLVSR